MQPRTCAALVWIASVVLTACGDGQATHAPTAPAVEENKPAIPTPATPAPSPTATASALATPADTATPAPTVRPTVPPPPVLAGPGGRCASRGDCTPGLFCDYPAGACYGAGTCKLIPGPCVAMWDPVCGCDGRTHGNTCEAARSAASVAYRGECR